MICNNCGKDIPDDARVCPVCGRLTSVVTAYVQPRPTITITPPMQDAPPQPAHPPKPAQPVRPPRPSQPVKKQKPTAARVFVVIFTVAAVLAEMGLIFLWFWPSILVTDAGSADSVTLYSMHALCRASVPYMSYILCGLCTVEALFTLTPLLRKFAERRRRLLIPKLMTILIGACYAIPYLIPGIADDISALVGGGRICHNNPFTTACFWLFVLLCVISELTIRNMRLVYERKLDTLRTQLSACGIPPNA